MPALTDAQQKFVDQLVATGCTPTEAARAAGYSEPAQEAYRLIRKPHVIAAVRELRERLIGGHAANLAVRTLIDIMGDKAAPTSARVSAARTVCEAAGHLGKNAKGDAPEKGISEMTEGELAAFIKRMDAVVAAAQREGAAAAGAVH